MILFHVTGNQCFYPAKRGDQVIWDHISWDFLLDVIDVVYLLELCVCLEEMIHHLEEESGDRFKVQCKYANRLSE